jgi:hypothetical protein
VTGPDEFASAYADALRGFLLVGGEGQLTAAYELGRRAVTRGITVLELSDVHHDALAAAMPGASAVGVVEAGRDFLREALSAYEMVRRGFHDARDEALAARQEAAMVRRLSELLAAPPASDDAGWLQEVAQLVAEQARHLCRSAASLVTIDDGRDAAVAIEHDPGDPGWVTLLREPALRERARTHPALRLDGAGLAADPAFQRAAATSAVARTLSGWMLVPMTRGDGRRLGGIQLFAARGTSFRDVDADVARHLALLATSALERRDHAQAAG